MKASKYNNSFVEGDSIIYFNSLTESSFRTSKITADSINAILENSDFQDKKFDTFISNMN